MGAARVVDGRTVCALDAAFLIPTASMGISDGLEIVMSVRHPGGTGTGVEHVRGKAHRLLPLWLLMCLRCT